MENTRSRTALVLGATGGVGGETAAALARHGWTVTGLARDPAKAATSWPHAAPIEWVGGDAMDPASIRAAAQGAALLVHAVNPPGYRDWDRLVVPMLEHSLAAARAAGARLVLPGNVYNYGPDAFPELDESAPQHPISRKGQLRVQMEQLLRAAARGGVPSLIVRAGDFFGPHASGNNWFSQGLVKPGRPLTAVTNPGRRGIGHQWSYLPDVAEAIAQLVEHEDRLAPFENVHLRGHYDANGTQMVETIRRVSARPLPVRSFPWWALRLGALFATPLRELNEMRYLWKTDVHMSNARVVELLGEEPHTPWDEAVRRTLQGLGCLPA